MSNIINLHRIQTSNIGDVLSSPVNYFDWLKEYTQVVDIWLDELEEKDYSDTHLILGGGGLLANKDFESKINKIKTYNFKTKTIWGAGHNTHDSEEIRYNQKYFSSFNLVGIRDYPTENTWVPCVSCLHECFNRHYEIKNEVVIYEHKNFPIDINTLPKKNNRSNNIEEVVEFLGSASTVLTNTYHGVYWATLLNRKVIIVDPFSSKFSGSKYKFPIASINNYKEYLELTNSYPNALNECKDANLDFAAKVRDLINL